MYDAGLLVLVSHGSYTKYGLVVLTQALIPSQFTSNLDLRCLSIILPESSGKWDNLKDSSDEEPSQERIIIAFPKHFFAEASPNYFRCDSRADKFFVPQKMFNGFVPWKLVWKTK